MPAVLQYAYQLAKVFIKTRNKKTAANHIIYQINSLVYAESKQPVESSVKIEIIQLINELISGKRPLQLFNGEVVSPEATDSSAFLLLTDYILKEVITFHRQKEKESNSDLNNQTLIKAKK
jgi:hypothetical protein